MKRDKEKIKKLLEQENQVAVSSDEIEAVVKMLSVLEEEDNALQLPPDFSEKVVQRVVQKQIRENRFGWFGFFLGVLGLLIALIVSLAIVNFNLDFGFLKNISRYSGLFIFGIAFIIILNFFEKKIFRLTSE